SVLCVSVPLWPIISVISLFSLWSRSKDLFRVAARDRVQDLLDDLVDRDALGFRVEGRDDAVAEHRIGERVHVVERHVEAALEDGADFAAQDPLLAGARPGAPLDQLLDER